MPCAEYAVAAAIQEHERRHPAEFEQPLHFADAAFALQIDLVIQFLATSHCLDVASTCLEWRIRLAGHGDDFKPGTAVVALQPLHCRH